MNTRQKLILGIAAIFMVTLTIVGVTYAYFITRVKIGENGKTQAEVTTAELASVEYAEGNGLITMDDVIPGDVEYKTFKVKNNNVNASQFNIILASAKPADAVSFVHSDDANVTNVCYAGKAYDALHSTEEQRTADAELATLYESMFPTTEGTASVCYKDNAYYNSIRYDLYALTEDEYDAIANSTKTAENVIYGADGVDAPDAQTKNDKEVVVAGNVAEGTGSYEGTKIKVGEPQVVKSNIIIAAGTQNGESVDAYEMYYVIKVTYEEENANQNIENKAALGILVSIN